MPGRVSGITAQPAPGDPVAGLTFGTDKNGQPTASGHYLFTYAASTSRGATGHGVAGSGYLAQLRITATDVRVAGIADDNTVSAAARPEAAADQVAKELVQKAFAVCVAATDAAPVDCPQAKLSAVYTSKNVRWALDGDPLAGANTTWDGNLGGMLVKGTFGMTMEYDSTYPGGATTATAATPSSTRPASSSTAAHFALSQSEETSDQVWSGIAATRSPCPC